MTQLLLKNEYNLLFESYKKKLKNLRRMKTLSHRDSDSQDTLVKLVLRCKQMHEAKDIVVQILSKLRAKNELLQELKQNSFEVDIVKLYY